MTTIDPNYNVAATQEPRTPRFLEMLTENLESDDGVNGFADVLKTPKGSGMTPGGLRRSKRNPRNTDFQEEEESSGDDDANVASDGEGEDDDDDANADGDAKKSCFAALFCCKIFRK